MPDAPITRPFMRQENAGTDAAAAAPRHWTWSRITHHALVVGALGSIALHVVLGMIAFMVWLRGPALPSGGKHGDGPVGLAVMSEGELATLAGGAPPGEETLPSIATPSEPSAERLPGPPSDEMSEIKGGGASDSTSGLVGGGDLGTGGEGLGVGGGGGSGGASFYGVEASGSRFAFIVDVSGSMGFDGRIEELRRQLDASISDMTEASSYCIATFSDNCEILGGSPDHPEWTLAGQTNKSVTRGLIRELGPKNSTHAFTAFQAVYKLKPRPDAIYFMTDGEVQDSDQIWTLVAAQQRSGKVPIFTICFMEKGSQAWMQKLADVTGGKFTCVRCN